MRGFDPLWSLVSLLCSNRGRHGQSPVISEKGGGVMNMQGGVVLSTACPAFPRGAAYYGNPAISQSMYPSVQSFSYIDQAYEIEFYPTGFGETGDRYLFSIASILRVYFDVEAGRLRVDFTNAELQRFSGAVDKAELTGAASKLILRITTGRISCELNGATLFDEAHGLTSFSEASGAILSIGNRAVTGNNSSNFYGWIGQFRRTVGDSRAAESSAVICDYEILGALDHYRENVVFHSHCDPTEDGVIEDTCGNLVAMNGSTVSVGAPYAVFGYGAVLPYPSVRLGPSPGAIFGSADFTIEWANKYSLSNSDPQYAFSIVSGSLIALALRMNQSTGVAWLTVNDVDHELAYTYATRLSVCRQGSAIAVFSGANRVALIDVGDDEINGDGYFHIGKSPSISGAQNPYYWVDELRVTSDVSRFNPLSSTIIAPIERFNEYGPRALSIEIVSDPDGLPLPGTLVRAYDRVSGRLVSQGYTDADGKCLLAVSDVSKHFLVAHHPTENALIFDHIIPVLV